MSEYKIMAEKHDFLTLNDFANMLYGQHRNGEFDEPAIEVYDDRKAFHEGGEILLTLRSANTPEAYLQPKYANAKVVEFQCCGEDTAKALIETVPGCNDWYIMDTEDGNQVYNSDGEPVSYACGQEAVCRLVADDIPVQQICQLVQTKYAVISVYTGYSFGVGMPQVEYFDDEEKAVKRLKEIWNQALDNQLAFDEEEDILPWRKLEHSEDWHAAKLWRPTEDRDIEDDYFAVWVVPVRN